MIPGPVVQVWDAAGTSPLGVVAGYVGLTLSEVLSDVGSLAMDARRDRPGVGLLLTDQDRQLRVTQPGIAPQWYVLDDDQATYISDDPSREVVSFTCRSLAGVLDEVYAGPSGGVGTVPTGWQFNNVSAGRIVHDLFTSAQGRGGLQGLTLSGGEDFDAAGDAWPEVTTLVVQGNESLLSVVKKLADARLLEWRLNDRAVEVYRYGGGLDRTLSVTLRPRRDVESAPVTRSRRSVVTDVIVQGAVGETRKRTQVLAGRRYREAYLTQEGASGTTLDVVGDLSLAAHAAADVQFTHDLIDGDGSPRPWRDYRPGDRIGTLAAGNSVTKRRVAQIALDFKPEGVKATLELGSLLKSAEERFAAQIAKLLPGQQT